MSFRSGHIGVPCLWSPGLRYFPLRFARAPRCAICALLGQLALSADALPVGLFSTDRQCGCGVGARPFRSASSTRHFGPRDITSRPLDTSERIDSRISSNLCIVARGASTARRRHQSGGGGGAHYLVMRCRTLCPTITISYSVQRIWLPPFAAPHGASRRARWLRTHARQPIFGHVAARAA